MKKECCTNDCRQGRLCPTLVRAKDFDHDDVDVEFTSDGTLSLIGNIVGSFGVFAILMATIIGLAKVPDAWETLLVLTLWGV